MFTGIVQALGQLQAIQPHGADLRLQIGLGTLADTALALGDSVAVNGVCLTIASFTDAAHSAFWADVSAETLALTTLGERGVGDTLNLELALTLQQPLGGHLLSGHVDGVAELLDSQPDARSQCLRFAVPSALSRYIARKGSVAVDGVSLTVNNVSGEGFAVNLVPHTLEHTNLHSLRPGSRVNLEVDMLARYLERLLASRE